MYKIKIKHIILILLFIFVIYNFFTYKEHFDFETKITMPNKVNPIDMYIKSLIIFN